jgi:NAD-dependent deacetylase
MKKRLVVLTGAGISAESGIRTFRDSNGLWEGYDVMDVASPEGWTRNNRLVLDFYNQRRKQALSALPNVGHKTIADLEKHFDVTVITQNVDNLHEKAGSTNIIHLHGELFRSRSTIDDSLTYDVIGWELKTGDKCEKGSQLRPDIVWFGEMVPLMDSAIAEVRSCDLFMIVGTSMVVYPAAGLINYASQDVPKYIVDPNMPDIPRIKNLYLYEEKGSTGVPKIANVLLEKYL